MRRFLIFEALEPTVRGEFTEASFINQIGIEGVTYEIKKEKPWRAKLVQHTAVGIKTIGAIVMSGPDKANRGELIATTDLTTVGGNGSILSVPVKVGDAAGAYHLTVTMYGGGKAATTIIVE